MHLSPGAEPLADAVGELHHQLAHVTEIAQRLDDAVVLMPIADAGAAWWGPAREAVQVALDIERERMRREALRARSIADQLRVRLMEASGVLPPGVP